MVGMEDQEAVEVVMVPSEDQEHLAKVIKVVILSTVMEEVEEVVQGSLVKIAQTEVVVAMD